MVTKKPRVKRKLSDSFLQVWRVSSGQSRTKEIADADKGELLYPREMDLKEDRKREHNEDDLCEEVKCTYYCNQSAD